MKAQRNLFLKFKSCRLLILLIAIAFIGCRKDKVNDINEDVNKGTLTYVNKVRLYKIDYPNTMKLINKTHNYDGVNFENSEESLNVYSRLLQFPTFKDDFNRTLINKNYEVTYKLFKNDWYIISGYINNSNKIFYIKSYYSDENDEVRKMILKYPKTNQKYFDSILPIMISSFEDVKYEDINNYNDIEEQKTFAESEKKKSSNTYQVKNEKPILKFSELKALFIGEDSYEVEKTLGKPDRTFDSSSGDAWIYWFAAYDDFDGEIRHLSFWLDNNKMGLPIKKMYVGEPGGYLQLDRISGTRNTPKN